MALFSKRMDELDIALETRQSIHLYCGRVRSLANQLSLELKLSSTELKTRLNHTQPAGNKLSAAGRRWTAMRVASCLRRASELATSIAYMAVKTAILFDQHYVPLKPVSTSAAKRAVVID